MLDWKLYEVTATTSSLNGVMLRGRIRKLGIERGFNVLVENAEDIENGVRFAVLDERDGAVITEYLQSTLEDSTVTIIEVAINNPVLSKLKVNIKERYKI